MLFRIRPLIALAALCLVNFGSVNATTYYVSPVGNDLNAGLSPALSWQTTAKVNAMNLLAGDKVLFEGGKTFSGSIFLDSLDKGSAANPVTISSYGIGRATINAGNDVGFFADNTAGFVLSNLNFMGAGPTVNLNHGISLYTDFPGDIKLAYVRIDNVEVSGFGDWGISIGSWNNKTGYRDVRITYASVHDNLNTGIGVFAQVPRVHEDIYLGHCQVFNNFGDPKSAINTGSGILLGCVNGAIVERSVSHDNGKNNFAPGEGPVGFWAYNSSNLVFQFNEAYSNHTGSGQDGGGFDLDLDVQNSVMQYNYSHDNDGAGYLLCCAANNIGNIIRYNVSQNDGRKRGHGGIETYGNIQNADIYNNTIFLSQITGGPPGIYISTPTTNMRLRNNVIQTTGGALLFFSRIGQTNMLIQGNCYYSSGSSFDINWNGKNYTSLDAWRKASGHEYVGSTKVGVSADPKLNNPGNGGTLNNADLLPDLTAYKTQVGSPLINAGINLNLGGVDFFGTAIPQGGAADIGAHETAAVILKIASAAITNQNLSLSVSGPSGTTNTIQISTNLLTWSNLTTFINTNGTFRYSEPIGTNQTRRFYRVRQL